ncbi:MULTISPECIES: polyamine aminopropyltransferase [unclassified Nitratiruptor]|uniref:polyamine aminopropyltransferase n=1 Tax=unclassified Nitratiruptor TaxID=2624044 RepID=UPI001915B093|nr:MULTISPECIES: polyamine aminopropyltransferase [unclassified Nitratiruptor]BCD59374.1 spermidine synthase [Nitratiruptor sp. YY08-10]BCD63298.1 spermidine synthase [Nitratiruptor sp. YY08-14]
MWFEEVHNDFFKQGVKVESKIYEAKSKYQTIEVYESKEFGRILVIDGHGMLCDKDEFIYHEMMAHVPVCTHKEPRRALVIGGGDGGVAKELLRHPQMEVDIVEIDEEVVNVCKEYFPNIGDWDNPRLNLMIDDGIEFIKNVPADTYDLILVDSTDPEGPAEGLFNRTFYAHVFKALKEDGIVVAQGESWWIDMPLHKQIMGVIGEFFKIVMPYRFEMYMYPGCNWNFILGSKLYHPTADIILQRADLIEGLRYYNSDIHKASFVLPNYVKQELGDLYKW